MSDRPTREECIKWVKMEAIFSESDFEKEAFAKEMVRQLSEATIHYLTERRDAGYVRGGGGERVTHLSLCREQWNMVHLAMPRWPEGYVSQNVCPVCNNYKVRLAKTCRACAPRQRPNLEKKGSEHPAWTGGFIIDRDGYIRTYAPDHSFPRKSGYVCEHVRVMELEIGRRILPSECVHHRDRDKQNNDLSNLELMGRAEHSRMHRLEEIHRRQRDAQGRFALQQVKPNA